jgi:hypothetical protein
MNRKERREYEKKYGTVFTMQKYRDDAFNAGFKEGVNTTYMVVMNMVAYSLNYKLGLGQKRLPEIMRTIADNIDSYRTGQLDAEDYKEIKKIVKGLGIDLDIK